MSTYTRARSRRQWRHPASRSKSHIQDKREGECRRQKTWVPVDAPQHPKITRSFQGLQGHEYIYDGSNWTRCDKPEEFANYLEKQAKQRRWFTDKTQRKGKIVEMKRPAKTPIEPLTITFPPWLSDWVAFEISKGRDPKKALAVIRNEWLRSVESKIGGNRYILGYAFHADTDDLHFDVVTSRQDGKGGRIGKAGLGLVGPWCVGTDRQLRAGAKISPKKQQQLRRSVANFRRRYGASAIPLDVELARALDAAADQVIGPLLGKFRADYAKRVPLLEKQHTAAQLAALEAAASKISEGLDEDVLPDPEMPEHEIPEPDPPLPPL